MKAQPCVRCRNLTTRQTTHGLVLCGSCANPPKGTYEKIKPLPAGKPLAPYRPPAAPTAAKFANIPGQGMLSLDDDDPQRIEHENGDD